MGGLFRVLSSNAPICAAASYVASSAGLVHTRGAKVLFLPHLVSTWDKANHVAVPRRTVQSAIPVLLEPYFSSS